MDLATRISLITPRSFEQIDKYSNIQMIKIQKHEYDHATRISFITPRSFDPTKPRELQVKLGKRWEVIGQDFAIEKVNNQTPAPASAPASTPPPPTPAASAPESEESRTNSGSRIVKIVCMSDTHSTQGDFG